MSTGAFVLGGEMLGNLVGFRNTIFSGNNKKFAYRLFSENNKTPGPFVEKYENNIKLITNNILNLLTESKYSQKSQQKDIFGDKKKEAEKRESNQYKKLTRQNGYSSLEAKDYSSLEAKDKVSFWTKFFLLENKNTKGILDDSKLCFRLVLSSVDFTKAIRSTINQSRISRRAFYSGKGEWNEETIKETEKNMIKHWFSINSNKKLSLSDEFKKKLRNAFKASENNNFKQLEFQLEREIIEEISKSKITVADIKEFLESSGENRKIYDKIHDIVRKELIKYGQKTRNKNSQESIIDIKSSDGNSYIVLNLEPLSAGIFEQVKGEYQEKSEIENYITAIQKTIKSLKEKGTSIDLKTVKIEGLNSVQVYKEALKYLDEKKGDIESKLKKHLGQEKIDVVNGITGLNAELANLLGEEINAEPMGNIQNEIKINGVSYSLGKSFSDTVSEQYKGFNIKNYVSSGTTIKIYEPDEGSGVRILKSEIFRYFSEDLSYIIRFLDANANVIQEYLKINFDFKQILQNVSLIHLPSFIRLTTALESEDNLENYFYQLNNLFIPASVIYNLLNKLLEQKTKEDLFKIFISHPPFLINVKEDMEKYNLMQGSVSSNKSTKIQFQGWSIKLEDYYQTF